TSLLDGDGRRQPLDEVHVRFLQLVEELAGVGGEALDIFALALGEERVEGERRLARAAEAGNHHQFVTRNLEREVFEIVLPRPADADKIFAHSPRILTSINPASVTRGEKKGKRG